MTPGFQNAEPLLVRTADGHNVVLQEPLVYHSTQGHTYRVPAGATSDGISTPPILWQRLAPFGPWWYPGVLHDSFYRNTLEMQAIDGTWAKVTLTKEYSDWLFKDAMLNNGVLEIDANIIFEGVNLCGTHAFNEDRNGS